MAEYIEREEFLKRIKPYDTSDKKDKALYNFALNEMMGTPTANVISITKGATNGDMVKAMFPNIQWDNECNGAFYGYKTNDRMMVMVGADFNWWNAPYKKGVEE